MSYTINNPGGGDCGYYAFAIALIDIIQNEYIFRCDSNTYDRWKKAGLTDISLKDILDIDLNQLHQSPYNYKKDLLFKLQISLRNVSVDVTKQDLFDRVKEESLSKMKQTLIEGSLVYGKFMRLVNFCLNKRGSLVKISQFNELALSSKILELAEKTAKSLKEKIQGKSFAQAQIIENAFVKKVLLHDILRHNNESVILEGVEKIKEPGRWATHSDLKEIATRLKINLYVVGKFNGKINPAYPTVSLQNSGNVHWTTCVATLQKPQQKKTPITEPVVKKTVVPVVKQEKPIGDEPPQNKSKVTKEPETALSTKEEQVINATLSTQTQKDKIENYRKHLKALMKASSTHCLFTQIKNKIDVDTIDTAEAIFNEKGAQEESDESFAARLQEAELRKALK